MKRAAGELPHTYLLSVNSLLFRNDEKELLATLDKLESENLEIISNLLECRQEDLKISRYNMLKSKFR